MMLIDVTYFTSGPRQILNAAANTAPAAAQGQNSKAVRESIEGYIAHYQPLYLRSMLGDSLASALEDYLADAKPVDSDFETLAAWLKESFADYVFFQIVGDSNRKATITGQVKLKSANSVVAPNVMQVKVWNEMVESNKKFVAWAATDGCPFHISIAEEMLTPINVFGL